jgi:hypothetical protein
MEHEFVWFAVLVLGFAFGLIICKNHIYLT